MIIVARLPMMPMQIGLTVMAQAFYFARSTSMSPAINFAALVVLFVVSVIWLGLDTYMEV